MRRPALLFASLALCFAFLASGCVDDARARRDLGRAYARRNEHGLAVKEYQASLRLDPGNAATLTLLANSEFELERLADAERHYREALRRTDELSDAHFGLGTLLVRQGRRREGAAAFERVLDANPMDVTVLLNVGRLYIADGRLADARERLERVLRLDPANVAARFNLGLLALREGKAEQAEEHFRAVEREDPRAAFVPYGFAAVAAHRGQRAEALRLLRAAMAKGVDDPSAIARDPAFATLRDDPEFRALVVTPTAAKAPSGS